MPEVIHTWRDLQIYGDRRQFDIEWCWNDWVHAAYDRNHLLEAKTLWKMILPGDVIEPLLATLNRRSLKECEGDLQRFADFWTEEVNRVLSLPRVLKTRTFSLKYRDTKGTLCFQLVMKGGVIFIIRKYHQQPDFKLSTFFVARTLVNGLAIFLDRFERNAVEQLVDEYSRCNSGRLPSRNNEEHFVIRRAEIDKQIKFEQATQWGFESESAGAKWIGVPDEPVSDAQLHPVDPPPSNSSLKNT